jgi:molybdopterin-guanine dinucleotide biosynthesis protein A
VSERERAKVAAAILAGGRARRLGGVHKGLIPVGGEPIVARQLRALAPFVDERVIVANDAVAYASVAAAGGARVVPDVHPDRGPLAGLEAALLATGAEALLLFACDLPFLDVLPLLAAPMGAAAIARAGAVVQPLHARYARSILPLVQARLAADRLRLLDLVDELSPWYVDVDARALTNINTPEELAAAERLVG